MSKTTTPPHFDETRKVIFSYNEEKFAKTIAKMKDDTLDSINVCVWAPINENGNMANILKSALSGEAFENLCRNALYTTYEGHKHDLQKIGVLQ